MDKILVTKLYQAFADAEDLFTEAELPTVKTIDKYRGQPQNPERFELFGIPAVFFSFKTKWEKSGKMYNGKMSVDFHIVQDATEPISNISTNIDEGLKQIDFLQMVKYVLDNFESPVSSKLVRVDDTPIETEVIIYDLLSYTCNYYEPDMITKQKFVDTIGDGLNITGKQLKDKI